MSDLYTQTITKAGRVAIIRSAFINATQPLRFGYMGIGTGTQDFTADSPGLTSECSDPPHTGYARVLTSNTIDEDTCMITMEGIFGTNNISVGGAGVDITEVGIVNSPDLGQGTWLSLAEIPPMPKNSQVQLRYVVNIIFGAE